MPLDLGVMSVSNKNWFYKLANEGQLIEDSVRFSLIFFIQSHSCNDFYTTFKYL